MALGFLGNRGRKREADWRRELASRFLLSADPVLIPRLGAALGGSEPAQPVLPALVAVASSRHSRAVSRWRTGSSGPSAGVLRPEIGVVGEPCEPGGESQDQNPNKRLQPTNAAAQTGHVVIGRECRPWVDAVAVPLESGARG